MIQEIIRDIEKEYGIVCYEVTSIDGGWLNRLWKVATDEGDLLVKQYSFERYGKNQILAIDAALQRMMAVRDKGIVCPYVYQTKYQTQGRMIRFMDGKTAYAVMSFCSGENMSPQDISPVQMRSLGSNCALIHKAFSELPAAGIKGYPIDGSQLLASLRENFESRKQRLPEGPGEYREALLAQEPILNELTADFFHRLPKGIAHEDFTPDNILLDERGVTAVIDFDRNQYSFLWHDIGRALLSFALDGRLQDPAGAHRNMAETLSDEEKIQGNMAGAQHAAAGAWLNMERVRAFMEGYNEHLTLTLKNIADALRITWCIEILWWINPASFELETCKATRYRDEIVWLTTHWDEIDTACSGGTGHGEDAVG